MVCYHRMRELLYPEKNNSIRIQPVPSSRARRFTLSFVIPVEMSDQCSTTTMHVVQAREGQVTPCFSWWDFRLGPISFTSHISRKWGRPTVQAERMERIVQLMFRQISMNTLIWIASRWNEGSTCKRSRKATLWKLKYTSVATPNLKNKKENRLFTSMHSQIENLGPFAISIDQTDDLDQEDIHWESVMEESPSRNKESITA